MERLSEQQINWICSRVSYLVNKYTHKLPFSDEDAQLLHDEVIKIEQKSRNEKLCQMLLITVVEYFDKLNHSVKVLGE